jgi:hypothetical protein
MMVSSAAMANEQRIHRYQLKKQKGRNPENSPEQRRKDAQDHKEFPFSVLLYSFLTGSRSSFSLLMLRFSC